MKQLQRSLEVREAKRRSEVAEFMDLPFRIYARDRNWVAPLRAEHRRELDRRRNPFFEHAEAAYFVARRQGQVVGRISAHTDERYNDFHAPDATGFWGFFECADDQQVADALFEAAGEWLAARGKTTMLGPASFTLNHVAGLLVDGFGEPPMPLMAYNPVHYQRLVEGAGFTKAQDLWAYRLDATTEVPAEIRSFAEGAEADGVGFRPMNPDDYWDEVRRFAEIYNHAWERNWGFVPLTEAEMHEIAKSLEHVIDPRLVFVAERAGEPVGASLTIPNVNEELVRHRGRLGPRGTLRMLYRSRRGRWESCRVVALGVRRELRSSGVGAHLYMDTLEAAKRLGYRWGEMSWILESNAAMNAGIRHMGGTVYKTYRMYARPTG